MNEKEFMLTSVLECSRTELYSKSRTLDPASRLRFNRMRLRREQGEPLQYILGEAEFMGLPFFVNPDVLIPRPETELMVERLLDVAKTNFNRPVQVLDIGTGSGNIAVSLAKFLPESRVTTIDVSGEALKTAARNAARNGVSDRVSFVRCGMGDFLGKACAKERFFDIIVSNPPYIPEPFLTGLPFDVKQEPREALTAGEDGLQFLRLIIEKAGGFIAPGGFLALEFGDGQEDALAAMIDGRPEFLSRHFYKDYTAVDRFLVAMTL